MRHTLITAGILALLAATCSPPGTQTPAAGSGQTVTPLAEVRGWAEKGDAEAQYSLGLLYERGRGVPQDYQEAAKWFRLAAEQGDAKAQVEMGRLYADGKGVLRDYREAIRQFRKAAEQGDGEAQILLGNLYYYGRGVLQNYQEAAKWYRKAAEQGYPDAQAFLGALYARVADYVKAHAWLNLASVQDPARAKLRDQIADQMTPEQMAQAHHLAAELARSIDRQISARSHQKRGP